MKKLLFFILLFSLASCGTTGPDYPSDADEILDFGIVYARYGNEWWSVQDGEKWNRVDISSGVVIPAKKDNIVMAEDFGVYAKYVEIIRLAPIYENNEYIVHFSESTSDHTVLVSLKYAWNSGKYKQIGIFGWMGSMPVQ